MTVTRDPGVASTVVDALRRRVVRTLAAREFLRGLLAASLVVGVAVLIVRVGLATESPSAALLWALPACFVLAGIFAAVRTSLLAPDRDAFVAMVDARARAGGELMAAADAGRAARVTVPRDRLRVDAGAGWSWASSGVALVFAFAACWMPLPEKLDSQTHHLLTDCPMRYHSSSQEMGSAVGSDMHQH